MASAAEERIRIKAEALLRQPDPALADFVKALARANAARDIARLQGKDHNRADGDLRSLLKRAAK